eukprot:gene17253-5052_t
MAASGWKIAAEVKSLIELSDETTNSSKNSSTHVFPFPSDDNSTKHGTTALYGTSVRYVAPADRVARCQSQALPKLPVGVLSGGKDATTRRKNIRETWATTSQCIFFIVGKSADEGLWPEDEAATYEDMILLDMEEVYFGERSMLSYKSSLWLVLAGQWFPTAKHVLKTDDDCYVHLNKLTTLFATTQGIDYWGRIEMAHVPNSQGYIGPAPVRDRNNKWFVSHETWAPPVFPFYAAGYGYVLSQRALRCYANRVGEQAYMPLEDVGVGIIMRQWHESKHIANPAPNIACGSTAGGKEDRVKTGCNVDLIMYDSGPKYLNRSYRSRWPSIGRALIVHGVKQSGLMGALHASAGAAPQYTDVLTIGKMGEEEGKETLKEIYSKLLMAIESVPAKRSPFHSRPPKLHLTYSSDASPSASFSVLYPE